MGTNVNDVDKSNIERKNSSKRMRRRKRMNGVYVFVVVLLVVTIGVTMSFTFLFNIEEIVVSGESKNYTPIEIVEASGIKAGDNLFRINIDKAEQGIMDQLIFVETAEIHRDFPSKLRIHVTRCVPAYNVSHDGGVLLVSRKGKILSDNGFYADVDNLPIIYGFDPSELEPGKMLSSKNENKYDAFCQLIRRFDRDDGKNIESIDISNEYSIIVYYRNGVEFRMGNWNDVEYKLDLAQHVMSDEIIKGKKGYLTMVGSNQCSFRSTGEIEEPEQPTEPPTDESGQTPTAPPATIPADDYVPESDYGDYDDWSGDNDYGFIDEDGDGIPDWYGDDFVDEDMDGIPDDYIY